MDCGPQSIPSEDCYKLGCCHDAHDLTCYYRLNGKICVCGVDFFLFIIEQRIQISVNVRMLILCCGLTPPPACSLDGHFVFSVRATDTELPITPSKLIVKDQPQCSPAVTTQDTAIFKIGVMDCGAKMKVMQN